MDADARSETARITTQTNNTPTAKGGGGGGGGGRRGAHVLLEPESCSPRARLRRPHSCAPRNSDSVDSSTVHVQMRPASIVPSSTEAQPAHHRTTPPPPPPPRPFSMLSSSTRYRTFAAQPSVPAAALTVRRTTYSTVVEIVRQTCFSFSSASARPQTLSDLTTSAAARSTHLVLIVTRKWNAQATLPAIAPSPKSRLQPPVRGSDVRPEDTSGRDTLSQTTTMYHCSLRHPRGLSAEPKEPLRHASWLLCSRSGSALVGGAARRNMKCHQPSSKVERALQPVPLRLHELVDALPHIRSRPLGLTTDDRFACCNLVYSPTCTSCALLP
ncbi:hypothetical protein CERZMDRAFT_81061 [Cercospora zeae-maydis SCOH1-5]|uniref:Uncharacterized protein n=1 Tax=Cercospora zeae-maydis SCOH1-5 TaxID=717836 RepID=A0A6A6FUN1_9PEZI|nr:hypothetical protein CERZMDRAFT_81061 [Cercospora zeae-maydis SCOH1-5]